MLSFVENFESFFSVKMTRVTDNNVSILKFTVITVLILINAAVSSEALCNNCSEISITGGKQLSAN